MKKLLFISFLFLIKLLNAQDTTSLVIKDSFSEVEYQKTILKLKREMDSLRLDSFYKDTLVPKPILTFNKTVFIQSKTNQRKSLFLSTNPAKRNQLKSAYIFLWFIFICVLMIIFKKTYFLQYNFIRKAWYNKFSFREYFDTQNNIFKGSKIFTWILIVLNYSIAIIVYLKNDSKILYNIYIDSLFFVGILALFFIFLQMVKAWFSFSLEVETLKHDFAIIFRLFIFILSWVVLIWGLLAEYSPYLIFRHSLILILILSVIISYTLSIFKFSLSNNLSNTQTSLFLFLYICTLEILPFMVLISFVSKILLNE